MRIGTGLSVPGVAVRQRLLTAVPTPFTRFLQEGDSRSSYVPGNSSGGQYPWLYILNSLPAGITAQNRAQSGRVVGNPTMTNSGNSIYSHRAEDVATYGGDQLIIFTSGGNDIALSSYPVANFVADLQAQKVWADSLGVKLAYCGIEPYCSNKKIDEANGAGFYDGFMARRAQFLAILRDPSLLFSICHFYIPCGEQPDINLPDNTPYFVDGGSNDGVHMVAAGQQKGLTVYKPGLDTLLDATRDLNSTVMYNSAWLTSEGSLTAGQTITRRFIVSGIARTGLALGASIAAGSVAGAQIRLNGGPWTSAVGTGAGSGYQSGVGYGYRIHNGDTIDIQIPLSASSNTAVTVNLQVGSETRTLTYTTVAAVTPATATAIGFLSSTGGGTTHDYSTTTATFPSAGDYQIIVNNADTNTINGLVLDPGTGGANIAATMRTNSVGAFSDNVALFTVTIPAGSVVIGAVKTLRLSLAQYSAASIAHITKLNNAVFLSATTAGSAPSNESDPHATGAITVPASGIMLGAFGGREDTTTSPRGVGAVVTTGTNNDSAQLGEAFAENTTQQVRIEMVIGQRGTGSNVALSFTYKFGSFGRVAAVYKAVGT